MDDEPIMKIVKYGDKFYSRIMTGNTRIKNEQKKIIYLKYWQKQKFFFKFMHFRLFASATFFLKVDTIVKFIYKKRQPYPVQATR